ncbi:MAG: MtaA/CmuA family methyltransferase [Candidatus Syntrophoarchaeum sp. WYZ-LMO15]|nr:MAG: MtaA/CmuA family methyltransferase [Candidatus Syntrophoarchaeum sp. WYZ-LMO15]
MKKLHLMSDEMSPRERFYASLEQNPVDRVSLASPTQTGIVDLMDLCGAAFPDAIREGEKMAKLAWAAHEYAGIESVRIQFTVLTEGEAMGAVLGKWKKKNQPVAEKPAVVTLEDIDRLKVPDPKRDGRMPEILKAARILAPRCEKEKLPLIATVITPLGLTLDAGVTDPMTSMLWFKREPEAVEKLMKIGYETGIVWAEALIDAGVDTIFLNGALDASITPDEYRDRVFPIHQRTISKIKEMGAYVVYHCCMDARPVLPQLVNLGVHAISVSELVDMKEAREIAGDKVALCGNVDPTYTLIKEPPEKVKEAARYCIDAGTDVLCPGCGYGPKTPLENMKALVEAGREYGHNARLARK